ncbi:cupredoxin domain-containing protein [Gallaecimonas kandeliae]|uniref:cupredoxin domain-containing protein n=1 Tax=Gallaecimonas kandeliae TaxID=3029055 RepID=UPI00264814AF|nr:cupredoxin domain-containing protein [Gallaecimonas kandeliae]WKE66344.1 cupredoxin domain-containing protein [Gallaecimonas kandeliae]
MLVNLLGLVLIALVIYWFWPRHPKATKATKASGEQTIVVDGGVYEPERPVRPAGQPIRLTFLRQDPSPCAQWVQFEGLDVAAELPVDKAFTLELPPLAPGEYPFHCQMKMYRGTLVVN